MGNTNYYPNSLIIFSFSREIYTQHLHTTRNFKIKNYLICLIFAHPQHLAALVVNMQSSKENSYKCKNDLDKSPLLKSFRPVPSITKVSGT
jgi:hypothetical protein